MNERQFNAIKACEEKAAAIASVAGTPHFYLPHGDSDVEFWRAFEAIAAFLDGLADAEPVAKVGTVEDEAVALFKRATIEELVDLPGIGVATARRIKAAI
jgi:hypothetical protein